MIENIHTVRIFLQNEIVQFSSSISNKRNVLFFFVFFFSFLKHTYEE